MTMNDIETQVYAMSGFVEMAKNAKKYSRIERHGFLVFAMMHACNAATMADHSMQYGFRLHDYKHEIIKTIEAVMNGKQLHVALKSLANWKDYKGHPVPTADDLIKLLESEPKTFTR